MDEVREFCQRVLGPGPLAVEAARQAQAEVSDQSSRVQLLAAAASACRSAAGRSPGSAEPLVVDRPADASSAPAEPATDGPSGLGLTQAVARELASATAALPERQREALVLRELLRLSHAQIATVVGLDASAVAPLLARARLGLRAERRGVAVETEDCGERDRALRVLTCRQDSEAISIADDDWLPEHLGSCAPCRRAHAAMLEASVCYRAWPAGRPRRSPVGGLSPGAGAGAEAGAETEAGAEAGTDQAG